MSAEAKPEVPYVYLLEGRDAGDAMRTTPGELQGLFAAFSSAEIDAVPAPGKWSLREQMCHLADCEIAWAWRLRQTFGEDNPVLQSFEQDPWARAYSGKSFTFPAAFETWRTIREWNLAFLDALSEDDKKRPATHPSAGPITLWNLIEIAAGHDLHHLASLRKLRDSRA
ncbi:DinB family protein [Terriglobus aquaticus]|uniref:DinB family protein n=1 Tax=Terriglobus aquaticus TaxID=940139 RepID=A0ABW9KN70_9BACT|nr:DinB family protein [Terriglobus aquaticus]